MESSFLSTSSLLCSLSLSLSLTHTHAHSHTLLLSLTHTHTLFLSLSLAPVSSKISFFISLSFDSLTHVHHQTITPTDHNQRPGGGGVDLGTRGEGGEGAGVPPIFRFQPFFQVCKGSLPQIKILISVPLPCGLGFRLQYFMTLSSSILFHLNNSTRVESGHYQSLCFLSSNKDPFEL